MPHTKNTVFILCLLFWLSACGTAEQSTDQNPEEVTENQEITEESSPPGKFVANPQVVPKPAEEVKTLPIGASAPDFKLPGVDGEYYQLSDFAAAKVLVIIFTCNHCPTAQAYEDRMIQLTKDYQDKNVAVVAISPNSPLALLEEECGYTDLHDRYEDMVVRAKDKNFNFPYLYDGDDEAVSIQYGPVATPHAFVFDEARKLQYAGCLDTSEKPGSANAENIRAALDAVLAGEAVEEPKTKTFGCSVKWGWKNEYTKKVNQEWEAAEVTLEDIDEQGLKDLLANDSDQLRLINIWATWCGPCLIEYPEFVEIHRMYKDRSFEFISLSADVPEKRDAALKVLQKKHSALRNFIFDKDDQETLINIVDPEWEGSLPYTILIEPGGKRIYTKNEAIDALELKKIIVEHPMIGRYY